MIYTKTEPTEQTPLKQLRRVLKIEAIPYIQLDQLYGDIMQIAQTINLEEKFTLFEKIWNQWNTHERQMVARYVHYYLYGEKQIKQRLPEIGTNNTKNAINMSLWFNLIDSEWTSDIRVQILSMYYGAPVKVQKFLRLYLKKRNIFEVQDFRLEELYNTYSMNKLQVQYTESLYSSAKGTNRRKYEFPVIIYDMPDKKRIKKYVKIDKYISEGTLEGQLLHLIKGISQDCKFFTFIGIEYKDAIDVLVCSDVEVVALNSWGQYGYVSVCNRTAKGGSRIHLNMFKELDKRQEMLQDFFPKNYINRDYTVASTLEDVYRHFVKSSGERFIILDTKYSLTDVMVKIEEELVLDVDFVKKIVKTEKKEYKMETTYGIIPDSIGRKAYNINEARDFLVYLRDEDEQ